MSNKSRLQTNNTNLQALINKANALPDAGSGDGGGSSGGGIESCTITITDRPDPGTVMYYIDANMTFCETTIMRNASYTVAKNSIFVVASSAPNISGATQKATFGMNAVYQAIG